MQKNLKKKNIMLIIITVILSALGVFVGYTYLGDVVIPQNILIIGAIVFGVITLLSISMFVYVKVKDKNKK